MSDEFDSLASARRLLICKSGALATVDNAGMPFASLVSVSADTGQQPLLLLSDLAVHTRNLKARPASSLLLSEQDPSAADPLVRERLTLTGHVETCSDQQAASALFLRDHPHAAGYAGFGDFTFYRLNCSGAHLVAGFGRIASLPVGELFDEADG